MSEKSCCDAVFTGYYGPKTARSAYKVISCMLINRATGEVVSRGLSICSPRDQFCRENGQSRAHIRADGKACLVWGETDSEIRNPAVINGLFDAGFVVYFQGQGRGLVPCLPTLLKSEPAHRDSIVLTDREQRAVENWRRHNGFTEQQIPKAQAM